MKEFRFGDNSTAEPVLCPRMPKVVILGNSATIDSCNFVY